MSAFSDVLRASPENLGAHNDLGCPWVRTGPFEETVDHVSRILAQEPENHETLSNCGAALNDLHRFDEALACFCTKAIKRDASDAISNRGRTLVASDHAGEALACFD